MMNAECDVTAYMNKLDLKASIRNRYDRLIDSIDGFVKRGESLNFYYEDEEDWYDHSGPFITPLHLAAGYGSVQAIRLLIAHGADVNGLDRHERTPIWFAARNLQVDHVKALLKLGADPSIPCGYSCPPLPAMLARWAGTACKDTTPCSARIKLIFENLEKGLPSPPPCSICEQDDNYRTRKMKKVFRIAELLLSAGASPHQKSDIGYSAFTLSKNHYQQTNIRKLLPDSPRALITNR